MNLFKSFLPVVLAIILTCVTGIAIAQNNKDTSTQEIVAAGDSSIVEPGIDSAQIKAVKEQIKESVEDSAFSGSDTAVAMLVKKIESITELINTANRISEKGFDTSEILENLPITEQLLGILELNFISRNAFQNLRTLKTTKSLLIQSEAQLESWQNILFGYTRQLANLKVKLAEVRKDPSLKIIPQDSLLRDTYFGQVAVLLIRWKMADSAINSDMLEMGILQNRLASDFLKTKDYLDKTNDKLKKYIEQLWIPEEPSLFKAKQADYDVSFIQAFKDSVATIYNVSVYYFERNVGLWIIAIIIILALYGWMLRSFSALKKNNAFSSTLKESAPMVAKHPLLSVSGLVLTFISLFLFNLPPSWNSLIAILLAIIFFMLGRLTEKTKKIFLPEFLIIFLVFNILSSLLKNSLGERWIHFGLDLLTTGYGILMTRKLIKMKTAAPPFAKNIFFVFTAFSAGALITNSYGSFMLAKILNNSAAYAIVTAIVLYITSQIIIQIIYLKENAYKENRFVSYLNLYNLQQSIGKLLRIAAIIGWVIIIMQQLNLFDYAFEWIVQFLTNSRHLGSHSFTFGSILVFILVIWFSSFLSKILTLFLGEGKSDAGPKKSRWGSMVILIRLGVLTTGIIIAFIASGIPLDKLTIIIGALGVGIGFGLQNIVNNLVSGVILAFEKPVQVGDAIEVGNRYGIIKEIGIRSSKLVTVEGSEVIVPNGDMLSEHIVNWTLSSHFRRVEIIVGVAYNTDLRLAEKILKEIVSTQEGIETTPEPIVLAHNFGESSIDFRLLFWCHIDRWVNVKSEVMMNTHKTFSEHGIEIPFPQRDINIKGAENLLPREENKESSK